MRRTCPQVGFCTPLFATGLGTLVLQGWFDARLGIRTPSGKPVPRRSGGFVLAGQGR
jgi:hypothetical protein